MKKMFRGHRLVMPVLLGMVLAGAVSVYAATTIGTDINTGGNLTAPQLFLDASATIPSSDYFLHLGVPEADLIPDLQGFATPTWMFQTVDGTGGKLGYAGGIGVELSATDNTTLDAVDANTGGPGDGRPFAGVAVGTDTTGTQNIEGLRLDLGASNAPGTHLASITGVYSDVDYISPGSSANVDTTYDFWSSGRSIATNPYFLWNDTTGVFRIKDDRSFNSVDQSIAALYNPQFTKYTPGATDYERVVLGQWNSNVAEIGTEASGTGSARALALITGNTPRVTIGSTGDVGIGTTTPSTPLVVTAGASATTTITVGELGLTSSKTCINMNRANGQPGSMYLSAAGTLVIENNYCR